MPNIGRNLSIFIALTALEYIPPPCEYLPLSTGQHEPDYRAIEKARKKSRCRKKRHN